MSSLIVPVLRYSLSKHPNADALSLAAPAGTDWQCCVRTDAFRVNDGDNNGANGGVFVPLAVYIPVDAMLPNALALQLGIASAKDNSKPYYRIKTIRLRGEVSQGLLVPLRDIEPHIRATHERLRVAAMSSDTTAISGGDTEAAVYDAPLPDTSEEFEGMDVAAYLDIKKWEPPLIESIDLRSDPPGFPRYSGPENYKNFPDELVEGERVWISEKLHGSNARYCVIDGELVVGTRRMTCKSGVINRWTKVAEDYNLFHKLRDYPGMVVFGEVYGKGVQAMTYGCQDVRFRVFDVYETAKNRYLDYAELKSFCGNLQLPMVPTLFEGAWSRQLLDLRKGNTVAEPGAAHIREGFVVKPICERSRRGLDRVILKVVSEDYLLGDWDKNEVE